MRYIPIYYCYIIAICYIYIATTTTTSTIARVNPTLLFLFVFICALIQYSISPCKGAKAKRPLSNNLPRLPNPKSASRCVNMCCVLSNHQTP